jgi:glycosyltransferase involved in cell wall biosynthesis
LQKKREYERTCFKEADLSVVTTERDKDEIISAYDIDPKNIRVIPNYVDTDIFKQVSDIPKTPASLVFIGRLSKEKNLHNLLDAVDRNNGIESITLVGDGPERPALEKRAIAMKAKVNFTGARPSSEIPGIISAHKIFVLCSQYEGMPKALIEAMTLGMPCLGTDVRGIRDIIRHNENGLLCPITTDGIASGLKTLTDNPELCQRLGEVAKRDAVASYGIEAVATLERNIIVEVLEKTQ